MASKLYLRQIIFGQNDAGKPKTSLAKSSANYQDFAEPQLLHEKLFLYALKIAIYESVHTKRAVSFCRFSSNSSKNWQVLLTRN